MSAYQGSWAAIFAEEAARQAREDREAAEALNTPTNLNDTAAALRQRFGGE